MPLHQVIRSAFQTLRSPKKAIGSVLGVSLYRNSLYLLIQSVVNSATGFVFWVVAARLFAVEEVGVGYALTSTIISLAFFGTLGLGMGIIRFLPEVASQKRLLNSALTVTLLASIVISLGFVGGVNIWSPRLLFLHTELVKAAGFVFFVAASALGTIAIQTFIGFRKGEFALFYTLISIIRLVLLFAFATRLGAYGIFAAWGLAEVISVTFSLIFFLPRLSKGYFPFFDFDAGVLKGMVSFTSANFFSDALRGLPSWILPLLIINMLAPAENAYFGVAWTLAGAVLLVPVMTSLTFLAEGSQSGTPLGVHIKNSLKLNMAILIPVVLVICIFGDKILLIMGKEYSSAGAKLLWLLAPAAIPAALNMNFVSIARVEKRLGLIILVMGAIAVITLGLSWLLIPRMGLMGVGVGWLAGQASVGVVSGAALLRRMKAGARVSPPGSAGHVPDRKPE